MTTMDETTTLEKRWKTLEKNYIIQRPWLTVRCDKVELPNGTVIPDYYVIEYPTWVNTIAVTEDGKMIMIRQYRYALGVYKYELCAGTMDETDASPLETAQRELMEETGFGGGTWQEFMTLSPNPTSMNNLCHTFLATGVKKTGKQHLDDTEDLTCELLDSDTVYDLLQRGEIVQSLMAAPLWKYFKDRK